MPVLGVNGIDLYYDDLNPSGDTRTPVLLITGLGGVGSSWGPLTPLIAQDRRVIVPDHRGCGRSTRTVEGQSIPQIAADMAGLIRELDCGPVHVVGSSTGGAIGQLMAARHRSTVRSLSLVASWVRSDEYFNAWFQLRKQVLLGLSPEEYVALTQFLLYSPDYWSKETPERLSEREAMLAGGGLNAKEIASARIDMIMAHDAVGELSAVNVPAIVLTGSHDAISPPSMGRALASAIPGAQFITVHGAGHFVHEEQPQLVRDTVVRFLDTMA